MCGAWVLFTRHSRRWRAAASSPRPPSGQHIPLPVQMQHTRVVRSDALAPAIFGLGNKQRQCFRVERRCFESESAFPCGLTSSMDRGSTSVDFDFVSENTPSRPGAACPATAPAAGDRKERHCLSQPRRQTRSSKSSALRTLARPVRDGQLRHGDVGDNLPALENRRLARSPAIASTAFRQRTEGRKTSRRRGNTAKGRERQWLWLHWKGRDRQCIWLHGLTAWPGRRRRRL